VIRVVLVDDEVQIVRALQASLEVRGYDVLSAGTGSEALRMLATSEPDIVVLDLGLPDLDGTEVLKRLRSYSDVPVIILTIREEQDDKVAALEAGADDYVTKPFGMEELLARMRAVMRRASPDGDGEPILTFGNIEIDLSRKLIRKASQIIHLTPKEYGLLEAMATHRGKLLTHRWLLSRVWGPGYEDEREYLRVFVAQLRKKLEDDPQRPRWILTDPGVGYRWAPH
jgi:two-component system, OmpR family, KDP operon response regulator KdpE